MSAKVLREMGKSVVLLDKGKCGTESSWAGGGIISPLYPWHYDDLTNYLSFKSQAVYENLCAELLKNTGIDPQYQRTGLLMMDEYDTPQAQIWLKKFKPTYQTHPQGVFFECIAQVRNPRLLQALKADVLKKGVKIIEHTRVEKFKIDKGAVFGVRVNQGQYLADKILMCGGAWSGELLNEPAIFPMKGQMIVVETPPNAVKTIVLNQGKYIIPRQDGKVLVGSTMEDVGFERSLSQATQQDLFGFLTQHFPALKTCKIQHHWCGFRPATRHNQPLIAKHAILQNLYINTGHFRNGLNTAPESANKIIEIMYG
jgi:glycine oxidase